MPEPTEGYVRLHRRIQEHPYWEDPERLRAWIDCLFMAAWRPHRRMVGTRQIELERGEFIASDRFLATRWGWSRGKVRRFLKAAQEAGEIEPTDDTSDGTIYLIVSYDDYQGGRPTNGTSSGTTNGPPVGPPSDQIEVREVKGRKGNTDEKKKNPSGSKKRNRAHQLPDDWEPNEKHQELARGLGLVMGSELAHFKDHHRAKGSTFKDWDAAFRTWLRRAKQFNRSSDLAPGSEAAKVKAGGPAAERPQSSAPRQGPPELRSLNVDDPEVVKKIEAWAKQNQVEAARLWDRAQDNVEQLAAALRKRGAEDKALEMERREFRKLAQDKVA